MGKDARAIRQEIEETRERMGDTIEALGYKADVPSRVKDNVQDKVETVKGTISTVVDNVKSAMGGASDRAGEALGTGRDKGSGLLDKGSGLLSDTKDRISTTVSNVGDKVSGMTENLQNVDVGGQAKRAVGMATENPLGLAIGALAVGFLAGLLVPVSDLERERIGPLREKIVEGAQSAADDIVAHGKAAVQETAQAAVAAMTQSVTSAAASHGISTGSTPSRSSDTADYGVLRDEPGTPGTASP